MKESDADGCVAAIRDEGDILISTGTLAEAWVVAGRRDLGAEMKTLVQCSKGVPRLA